MKHFYRILLILVSLFLTCAHVCDAQGFRDSLSVYFRQGSHIFEPELQGNGDRCDKFVSKILEIQNRTSFHINKVEFIASASPEGKLSYNTRLSQRRAASVANYLHRRLNFADSVLVVRTIPEDWETLEQFIFNDPDVPHRDEVLEILRQYEGDEREDVLRTIHGGESWRYVFDNYFHLLRSFRVLVHVGIDMPILEEIVIEDVPLTEIDTPIDYGTLTYQPTTFEYIPAWTRQIALKTNLLGWALLGENIAIEVDVCPHLSVSVPFYYSGGLDYFKETLKFRGIVLQPELRWYPAIKKNKKNNGFFLGAHFGLGWYNFALDGDYRVQDHGGNRPAYGGGLGLGYALQFKKRPNWEVEFTLGGGVYDVLYDTFYNENNGPYNEKAVHDVWFGIDNAAISFSYNFDLKKKGGKK